MIKFYSNNCPNCQVVKMLMDSGKIEYELISDENVFMPVANENNIRSMPFGEIDGVVLDSKELRMWVHNKIKKKKENG